MSVSVTFRQLEPTQAIKEYATDKVQKLQKFLRRPMVAKVTLSLDRHEQIAEVHLSSGGDRYDASESSEDMYASIDRVIDTLERLVRAAKGAHESKRRRGGESLKSTPRNDLE